MNVLAQLSCMVRASAGNACMIWHRHVTRILGTFWNRLRKRGPVKIVELGRTAYNTYRICSLVGYRLPEWEQLPQDERTAWISVGMAVWGYMEIKEHETL